MKLVPVAAESKSISVRTQKARRRLVYRLWRLLPVGAQRLAVSIFAPKVSLGLCAVIRDRGGRVLLAHHTYRHNAWGLPGGFIERHEQLPAALARELCEELGVNAVIGPLLCAESSPTGCHVTLYYEVTISGLPQPDGVEIDAYRYASPSEAYQLIGNSALYWLVAVVKAPAASIQRAPSAHYSMPSTRAALPKSHFSLTESLSGSD